MIPFLKQVADHYYNRGDIENRCFVFPNRRSMVFFRKYLCEAVAGNASSPLQQPQLVTINDFFYQVSGVQATDRVRLLLELYACYKELNPSAESLDEFIFWGDVILGDFNDVDKYMVEPKQLFANLADFRQIQDTYSYLTETQRRAIEGFISHFSELSGHLTVDTGKDASDVKSRFLRIWNLMYPLYESYNMRLSSKSMAYEGMVYRSLADKLRTLPAQDILEGIFKGVSSFVFVGLNALNECEKTLLRKLRDNGMAEFCWDWAGELIRDPQNRSSFFMADNVAEFPPVMDCGQENPAFPKIRVISMASSVGQAKRLPDILKDTTGEPTDCAVILPDENLLIPVLNSIPEEIKAVNVTMGLPMSGSRLYALMSDISSLQLHAVCRKGKWFFYHKQVRDLFADEIFRMAADKTALQILDAVMRDSEYYIPEEKLKGAPLLDTVFVPVIKDPKMASGEQTYAFAEYQKTVVRLLASAVSGDESLALELEYAKEYYKCINILQDIGLEVLPMTYIRLLTQLLGTVSVPFRGEPLKGLQIMGPLETRALDFRNLVIMSANEGVFPRRSISSSFIPPELRRGFGLPTYEYQDAVWAYYFYRMISRAENVWMLTDSRTEGVKSGEESRYIKQLEYHFNLPVERYVVKLSGMKSNEAPSIEKTEADVKKIKEMELSATSVQNYLSCPARFYYGSVKELEAEEELLESLDYGMFGTVYHNVMRALYSSEYAMREDFFFDDSLMYGGLPEAPAKTVHRSYVKDWLNRKDDIKRKVDALIVRQLNAMDVRGRNLVVSDVIVRYVLKTLERDLEQIDSSGQDFFTVLGRELKVKGIFHGQRFKGFIDRLDSFSPCQARVVDYKTGKVLADDEEINDGNAVAIADRIFAPDVKERPKIALQFHIYDMLVQSRDEVRGRTLYNCVYSASKLFREPPLTVPWNRAFYERMSENLVTMLDEMYDLSVPFRRTDNMNECRYCDFKSICGR